MGFDKGHKKHGGRKKGTENRVTANLKEWIVETLCVGKEKFSQSLAEVDSKEFLRTYLSLLAFVIPKQQAMSVEAQISAEYKAMQEMMATAPSEVVEQVARRVLELQERENNTNQ